MFDWLLLVRNQKRYWVSVFVATLQGISAVALLASSAWLISRAAQQPPVLYLSIAVVGVRAFAIGRAFFRYVERLISHDAVFRGLGKIRGQLLEKITPFIPAAIRSNSERLTNLVNDTERLQDGPLRVATPISVSLITSVVAVALIGYRSIELGMLFALLLALGHLLVFSTSWLTRKSDESFSKASQEIQVGLLQHLNFFQLNRNYGLASRSRATLNGQFKLQEASAKKVAVVSGAVASAVQLWLVIALLAVTYLVADKLLLGSISAVEVAVFILLPLALGDLLTGIVPGLSLGKSVTNAAGRVREVLGAEVPKELTARHGGQELPAFRQLELRQISINYPTGPKVIDSFSLTLDAGQSLFITGESGSGKSSVALVLAGLLQPSAGEYLINGKSFSELTRQTQVSTVGLIEQAPHIFPGSIRTNLKLAKPDATDAELLSALQAVGLSFQERGGLDLELGEQTSFISGGEAHRIALARAILADTKILILDEPSANLDYLLATEIIDLYLKAWTRENRALVVISHDITLSKNFDRVIQLPARHRGE